MKKTNRIISCASLIGALMLSTGCAKETEKPEVAAMVAQVKAEEAKEAKIKRFISIAFESPVEKIRIDEKTKEYVFGANGEHRMDKDAMVSFYDQANEYKFKYEK